MESFSLALESMLGRYNLHLFNIVNIYILIHIKLFGATVVLRRLIQKSASWIRSIMKTFFLSFSCLNTICLINERNIRHYFVRTCFMPHRNQVNIRQQLNEILYSIQNTEKMRIVSFWHILYILFSNCNLRHCVNFKKSTSPHDKKRMKVRILKVSQMLPMNFDNLKKIQDNKMYRQKTDTNLTNKMKQKTNNTFWYVVRMSDCLNRCVSRVFS